MSLRGKTKDCVFQKGLSLHRSYYPPKEYSPEELWKIAYDYFLYCVENPIIGTEIHGKDPIEMEVQKPRIATMQGLMNYADMKTSTYFTYKKDPDYEHCIGKIENYIFDNTITLAASNEISPSIATRMLGLADKKEVKNETASRVVLYTPDNGRSREIGSDQTIYLDEGL